MTRAMEGIATDHRAEEDRTTRALDEGRRDTRARSQRSAAASVTAQIIALPDLHDSATADAANPDVAPMLRDWNPLHQIKARLQVCVGEATLSVGELLAAKEHQVLRLDRAIDEAVDLTIEGKVVARGQLVALDGHFAVRITELPVPLRLAAGT